FRTLILHVLDRCVDIALLYLECHADLLGLRSFPTRRSSDLPGGSPHWPSRSLDSASARPASPAKPGSDHRSHGPPQPPDWSPRACLAAGHLPLSLSSPRRRQNTMTASSPTCVVADDPMGRSCDAISSSLNVPST